MNTEVQRFCSALSFLTRIPLGRFGVHDPATLSSAMKYFPAVGFLVGLVAWIFYSFGEGLFSPIHGALFALVAATVITGAFHEDGFADVCDAFGGYTEERRREIMKDSRVGSFAATGLVFLLLAKLTFLAEVPPGNVFAALTSAHVFSRWSAPLMLSWFQSSGERGSTVTMFDLEGVSAQLLPATMIMILCTFFCGVGYVFTAAVLTMGLSYVAGHFFLRWIGVVSGDCLGTVNQLVEVLMFALAWRLL